MIIICIDTLDLQISFFLRVPDSHFFLAAFHETVNAVECKIKLVAGHHLNASRSAKKQRTY